ncbi:6-pyruvoyl trahydropterin synthase family protein [Streptoalloteichus hindustanus]|uniref:6-carboxy-5,6,7,8-tetrahydropterin synthase n=1 Tax=Streptoalloteichus hindustanus TaxID=2017 RepID=A0A1M5D089_STRHI|nr:6-carboxytetrahydropterin synthase [Streptoalloteichus hindustanus]SHF60419.1 6-pyruvoyltetrahydropterin/6-carboxytetrahydropterin synthase [Streptoalloteichus hindustanus]
MFRRTAPAEQADRLPLTVHNEHPVQHSIAIEHAFDTAHRLPELGGKCASLHGHSWRVRVVVSAISLSSDFTVVEFGAVKAGVRQWIDTHLDHGTMLGHRDPLTAPLAAAGCKVFRFGSDQPSTGPESLAGDLAWPTVEAVAVLLRRVSHNVLRDLPGAPPHVRIGQVVVRETRTNSAAYGPEEPA